MRRACLASIFLFAAAARLIDLDWDQGHAFHPDERAIAFAVERLSFRPLQLDPGFFAYGSLPIYLIRMATGVVETFRGESLDFAGRLVAGRALSGLAGLATLALLLRLGTRLYGRGAGILACGLLAACVLHIQHSRFMTSESMLTLLTLAAVSACLRIQRRGATGDYLAAGALIGLAVATKLSAAPLLAPYLAAAILRVADEPPRKRHLARFATGLAAAGVAFALGEPYAILDFANVSRQLSEQAAMVRQAGSVPYTLQYVGAVPYVYDLTQMVLWGMSPLLGLAALWATLARIRGLRARRSPETLVLLAWVVPYFLLTGWFEVKFLRYLLPLYPILILWAAAWLWEGRDRGAWGAWRLRVVAGGTVLAAIAFVAVYRGPHTAVRASEWIYANVPAGSTLLLPHWDEGLPLPLPGAGPDRYHVLECPYYEPDTPEKVATLVRQLTEADYVVFPTRRIYGSIANVPGRYPQTARLLRLLFAGELGFRLVLETASRPRVMGVEALDELADESFSVYDHPKVLVFARERTFRAEELLARLAAAPPPDRKDRDLLLRAGTQGSLLGLAWARDPVRASLPALAWFVVVVEILGRAGQAVFGRWLPRLWRPAASYVLGPLAFAWVAWTLGHLVRDSFTTPVLTLLFAGAAGLAFRFRPRGAFPMARPGAWIAAALFWGSFALFLAARAWTPAIYWGEKPMDLAILNTLTRTSSLPAPEPWFAGSSLAYTYFGHFLVAAVGKLCVVHPALTFNLGIALVGALSTAGAFSLGCAVGGRARVGLLCAILTVFAGNLSGPLELARRRALDFDYFWATSRVVPDTINEYPLWSLLFADLHAHVLALPFALTFLALAVAWTRGSTVIRAALLGLTLGAVLATSVWSAPTYILFLPFLLMCHAVAGLPRPIRVADLGRGLAVQVVRSVTVAAVAIALHLPFWLAYRFAEGSWGFERDSFVRPQHFALVFGFPIFVAVSFLTSKVIRSPAEGGWSGTFSRGAVVAMALGMALAALLPGAAPFLSVRTAAIVLGLISTSVALDPGLGRRGRAVAVLFAYAFLITAGCDVVHVWDRMNTIFKFYLEAWLFFAAATAGALPLPWRRIPARRPRILWRGALAALVLAAGFTAATAAVAAMRTERVRTPRPTLDGAAYLAEMDPAEGAAVAWLNERVAGTPTIAEAWGEAYGDFARVSMHTGLPTVLGWEYHVHQRAQSWPQIEERKRDLATLFASSDAVQARAILDRYGVSYVFVGALERRLYGASTAERLAAMDGLFVPAYTDPEAMVLAVKGRGLESSPAVRTSSAGAGTAPAPSPAPPLGRFQQPRGVAVAPDGSLFVADFDNHRIQKLGPSLEPLLAWGGEGSGPGRFRQPCQVAVMGDEVYVADTWNGRIQVFDLEGRYQREWGGDLFGPRGIAAGGDGRIYVADTGNHRVRVFDPVGHQQIAWGGLGNGPGQFREPTGIAVDAQGTVVVCDNGNARVQMFDGAGRFLGAFPVPGWRVEVYSEPKVALDEAGLVWVTVPLLREVRAYGRDGTLKRTIAGGSPGSSFATPLGIAYSARTGDLVITQLEDGLARIPLDRPKKTARGPARPKAASRR